MNSWTHTKFVPNMHLPVHSTFWLHWLSWRLNKLSWRLNSCSTLTTALINLIVKVDVLKYMYAFYPSANFAEGHCRCLRLSVRLSVRRSMLVRAITRQGFDLEKTIFAQNVYLGSLPVPYWKWGWLTLTFKVIFDLNGSIFAHFSLSVP